MIVPLLPFTWGLQQKYKTYFYSPVKQGNKHSLELSRYLGEDGTKKIWVNTIVVFSHPAVDLKIVSPKVPVIYLGELHEYLNKGNNIFTDNRCKEISNAVSKLILC